MLYSVGKDSAVVVHLACKAFYPAVSPDPLLHVDTTWKFDDMHTLRDRITTDIGARLILHRNPTRWRLASIPSTTARHCTPTCGRRKV